MSFLQPCKTYDIEALKDVGSVGWVCENLDVIVVSVIHKLKAIVGGVPIEK